MLFWIIGILIFLLYLEIAIIGYFSSLFHLRPSYRDLLENGVLIKDKTENFIPTFRGQYYKSIILTKLHLIITDSFFTSIENINNNDVECYNIKYGLSKKKAKITVYLSIKDEKAKFSFKTRLIDDWINAFSRIGLEEQKSS